MSSRLLVLTWHNVHPTWCFPASPGAGAQGLARQLAFCRRAANVVPLERAAHALAAGRPLPRRAVALTFDDGYRDSLDVAVPMLRQLGLPATFFLVPGLLDGTTSSWWEVVAWVCRCARATSFEFEGAVLPLRTEAERRRASGTVAELLKKRSSAARSAAIEELRERCRPAGSPPGHDMFLDWTGAAELARMGFEIGSHSSAHDILSREDGAAQRADLVRSRRDLEDNLQVPVRHLAYPNGKGADYDDDTIAAARDAGFEGAWTTHGGRNAPETPTFELRRYVVEPQRGPAAFGLLGKQWWDSRCASST
ncbi:polysaccharide deacetylase family protein [Nocardioides xinjiangensis]|uniref:polysaccharide deacetylase family protein n=1 Tax=Nocardioides xinjiangensis TaxID=2817376 RepID=UPI001B30AA8E|nr:polysaccharide deacetylase family protein [Nocardioides sp. SYSU D00514]